MEVFDKKSGEKAVGAMTRRARPASIKVKKSTTDLQGRQVAKTYFVMLGRLLAATISYWTLDRLPRTHRRPLDPVKLSHDTSGHKMTRGTSWDNCPFFCFKCLIAKEIRQ